MTLQIILVLIFCVMYFITAIDGIKHAEELNDVSENEYRLSMFVNSIAFMLFIGFGIDWNFNGWAIALAIIALIGLFVPKPKYRASANMVIISKLIGLFLLYKAGFFNCLL